MAKGEIRTRITFNFGRLRSESERARRELEFTSLQLLQYESLLRRTLGLAKRFGLPEDVRAQITTIQRLISVAIQLERAYRLLDLAMESGLGPIGWISMALRVGSSIATMSDLC